VTLPSTAQVTMAPNAHVVGSSTRRAQNNVTSGVARTGLHTAILVDNPASLYGFPKSA
jgi:hypothetical protein